MISIRSRPKRLESAISICLIVVLFLIGLGVFIKQSKYDMARFGIRPEQTATAQLILPRPETGGDEATALDSLTPDGFEAFSKTETYIPENLYEKINGKAPLYIESGFVKLLTQRFVSKKDESLGMELFVYDMADIKNAFSVYSVQKRANVESLPDMQFAYRTGNAVYFVHGKYYIELIGYSVSDELFEAMSVISQKLRSKLAVEEAGEIAELNLFPRTNYIAGSSKLYLTSAFGFEGLTNTFVCQYKFGDETITAFFSRRSGPQDAKALAESYCNFLIDNEANAKPTDNETLKAVAGKVLDFYGTTEIIFAIGPFVAGIHEAENQQAAEQLAVMLINKLGEVIKAANDG